MLDQHTLEDAIRTGTKLSGAKYLVPGIAPPAWYHDPHDPASPPGNGDSSLPPFLLAFFQQEGSDDAASALLGFELLSLAVRHHFLVGHGERQETMLHRKTWGTFDGKNTCKASDLANALRKVANEIASSGSLTGTPSRIPGLKLVGIRIEGDLDLSKLDLPFSVRLVGCWIDGALLMDRTKLVTLDLSGSVISFGASCNFMEAKGALRIRRTVLGGPLDLGGATIHATLDASDCIIVPKFLPPSSVAFVGDRNALNLSQARIDKEARLNRVRIYGGLNLRSTNIGGAFFLDDAIVYSPIALVELIVFEEKGLRPPSGPQVTGSAPSQATGKPGQSGPGNQDPSSEALGKQQQYAAAWNEWEACKDKEASIVWLLRGRDPAPYALEGLELERLDGLAAWRASIATPTHGNHALLKLVKEHPASAYSALRGSGCHVSGVWFARSSLFLGSVVLKSATIGDRVTMNGSWFRRHSIGKLIELSGMSTTDKALDQFLHSMQRALTEAGHVDPVDRPGLALDLRDSEINGTIDFRKDFRELQDPRRKANPWREKLIAPLVKVLLDGDSDALKAVALFNPVQEDIFKYWSRTRIVDPDGAQAQHGADPGQKELLTRAASFSESMDPGNFKYLRDIGYLELKKQSELRQSPGGPWTTWRLQIMQSLDRPPARPASYIDSPEQVALVGQLLPKLGKDTASIGRLASTIISGEMDMSGAKVGGGIRARFAIMNVSGGRQHDREFKLVNATVAGNLDLRNTVGFCNIDAKQLTLGGSVRLTEDASDDPFIGRTRPQRERASLVFLAPGSFVPRQATNNLEHKWITRHRFQGATIGGDAYMLFDDQLGPSLDFRSATIGGRLSILPALGGVELTSREYAGERTEDRKHRHFTPDPGTLPAWASWLARVAWPFPGQLRRLPLRLASALGLAISPSAQAGQHPASKPASRSMPSRYWLERMEGTLARASLEPPAPYAKPRRRDRSAPGRFPSVDLRSAASSSFEHPPSAWPVQDHLRVEGFTYKSTAQLGPLVPARRILLDMVADRSRNSFNLSIWAFLAAILSFVALLNLDWLEQLMQAAGPVNSFLVVVTFLPWFALLLVSSVTQPPANRSVIRATDWLMLQRRRLNTGRQNATLYPFQPFIHAAESLRVAGRIRAANTVELERLRLRRKMLSRRRDLPLIAALKAADLAMEYGYRPMRLVMLLWILVIFGSLVATTAGKRGGVSRQLPACVSMGPAHVFKAAPPCENTDFVVAAPEFSPFLYSIDASLPLVDLGQEKHWTVTTNGLAPVKGDILEWMGQAALGRWLLARLTPIWQWFGPWYFGLARLVGWALTAIVSVAIVARLEALIARNEA
ncbi:MAG: hypothetical protein VR75_11645 [Hyphomonadaceae bacterium BRH_c29]|nr:MAG: hypothetical protein VR75_11645 [Hyphomonadaceae bacterium BRH_c29]